MTYEQVVTTALSFNNTRHLRELHRRWKSITYEYEKGWWKKMGGVGDHLGQARLAHQHEYSIALVLSLHVDKITLKS